MEILDSHVQLLHAIANRVIPADETAGAGDNESMGYVAEVMMGDLNEQIDALRAFLDMLNVSAKIKHRRVFTQISAAQQDALLMQHQETPVFQQLVTLVHEGYWASEAGRKTVGFEAKG
jgi:hypothetical protein